MTEGNGTCGKQKTTPTPVPEGGELPITAGGMTGGNGTCGKQNTTPTTVPEGGEQEKEGMRFAPFGDDGERAPADPQVPFPTVIPPAVIGSSPPSGTVEGKPAGRKKWREKENRWNNP